MFFIFRRHLDLPFDVQVIFLFFCCLCFIVIVMYYKIF